MRTQALTQCVTLSHCHTVTVSEVCATLTKLAVKTAVASLQTGFVSWEQGFLPFLPQAPQPTYTANQWQAAVIQTSS